MRALKWPKYLMFDHRATPVKTFSRFTHKYQTGASMLEVLIAILIMSFGISGAALLMAATMQYNKTSQYQMVALQIATQLAETMRANTDGFMADAYVKTNTYSSNLAPIPVPICANAAACSSTEIGSIDKAQIANTLRLALPGGDFNIQRNGTRADIWIMWMEPSTTASMALGSANCRAAAISANGERPRCLYIRAAL